MSTWALSVRGRSNGIAKRNSGPPAPPNRERAASHVTVDDAVCRCAGCQGHVTREAGWAAYDLVLRWR